MSFTGKETFLATYIFLLAGVFGEQGRYFSICASEGSTVVFSRPPSEGKGGFWYKKELGVKNLLHMPEYKTRSSTYDNTRLLLIKDVKLMDSGVFGYTSSSTRESHGVLLSVMGTPGMVNSTALTQSLLDKQCWSVMHSSRICALKGSSVDMHCLYSYPKDLKITTTIWYTDWKPLKNNPDDISVDEQFQNRVEYIGNKENNCTLRINQLRERDTLKKYKFRFINDQSTGYSGSDIKLSLTNLQVIVNPITVNEGQNVSLTCRTTCILSTNPIYIWYKNSHPVSDKHIGINNTQHLNQVTSEDAGSYSCAVKGHEEHPSPAETLNVRYAPKSTSLSVSRSGELVEGSVVTLTCNSDANPPVQNYTWNKKTENETVVIGTGKSINLTLASGDGGLYYCTAWNEVGFQNSSTFQDTLSGAVVPLAAVSAAAVVSVIVILLVLILVWLRKRGRNASRVNALSSGIQQRNNHSLYAVSGIAATSSSEQGMDVSASDDVQYASVQFKKSTGREMPFCPTAQSHQEEQDVQYAAVNTCRPNAASCTGGGEEVYSTINKTRTRP
ncbi:B-cell receptor CD22-like [Clupea harengus]|uniref:B-cell receptor CD22 n=1 Tax=Clupea harengus TaxID=7950 RepID=A0A6P8EP73_CLUHA|nr:B-cell receptor CD22-like [Clupea harengus]XP_031417989.1 B-cell receptor CD22-like [Clupea harengus]